ncbi:DUF4363 family protein [Bacillaceae bacterium S4-13-58]
MKKFMLYAIPWSFILIFIAIMLSGSFLKQPISEEDRLLEAMKSLETSINHLDWEKAEEEVDYIQTAWDKIVFRVQFSVERENMMQVDETISRIKGGVKAQDKNIIMEEIYYFYTLWDHLGK